MNRHIFTIRYILSHPLNAGSGAAALKRYICWQIGSRLVPGPVLVPFINQTRLVMIPGMTGATQNFYTGLHEFSDCGFMLHLLRPDDLFIDVGSNVGVYTVLASGAVGSSTIAFEPIPNTFTHLLQNLQANDIRGRVEPHNVGLGSVDSVLRFTADRDTANHVILDNEWAASSIEVPVRTLDSVLAGRAPTLIKIDVEGWESEVLAGADYTLKQSDLHALIIEMNGNQSSLNSNEQAVHTRLLDYGFVPSAYDPFTRELKQLPSKNFGGPNTLYCRHIAEISQRLTSAPPFSVNGRFI